MHLSEYDEGRYASGSFVLKNTQFRNKKDAGQELSIQTFED
jgi:hypothetical protein